MRLLPPSEMQALLKQAAASRHVLVSELPPSIIRVLREVGYGKRDIEIEIASTYTVVDYADDGHRAFTAMVNLDTGHHEITWGSWGGANMFSPLNRVDRDDTTRPIPVNGVVIKGHTGGGKPVYAYIRARPDNMEKLLPASAEVELSSEEKTALSLIRGIKSSYRRDAWDRAGLGEYSLAHPLVKSLASKGMIKVTPTGITITLAGKNADIPRNIYGAAAEASPFAGYADSNLCSALLKQSMTHLTTVGPTLGGPATVALKPMINGLIRMAWEGLPGEASLAKKLWMLFEGRGPSQSQDAQTAGLVALLLRKIPRTSEGKMKLAAVSLELLRRSRQINLAAWVEMLLERELAVEIKNVVTKQLRGPAPVKTTRLQNFEAVAHGEKIQSLVKPILAALSKRPGTVETYLRDVETFVFMVAEDCNWHNIKSVRAPNYSEAPGQEYVGDVSQALHWGLNAVALFGVGMFTAAGMPAKAKALTKEALAEFPDSWMGD